MTRHTPRHTLARRRQPWWKGATLPSIILIVLVGVLVWEIQWAVSLW